ncbi:MAG: YgeY family selenium metabolism-linked hydrolase [Synergistaceae bacterium]|nr:YgeY family selenium metabolism-linked hydrolase [Synergistaceae bacterium]
MHKEANAIFKDNEEALLAFVRELVRTPSFSDHEEAVAALVKKKMEELGYDEAVIDETGNVVGRIGNGPRTVLFDSHMDTVEAGDEREWRFPPFAAEISDGRLYGRGSVDMKSALAASVYAGAAAGRLGWDAGKTIYVTGTVCEEYCDGESLKALFGSRAIKPDCVVICEPSDNTITLGHKGKAQVRITTHGVSAHGSAPEKGINAVYEMAEIIRRVERKNQDLMSAGDLHGTLALSDISCVSASLNAVPASCSIYLDRRTIPGETEQDIRREMDALIDGKRASWEVGVLRRRSWTGRELVYTPMHEAWRTDPNHALTKALEAAYEKTFGDAPRRYDFWDFSTNAVTPVKMGIPTIGFGPGEYKLAHMVDENCEISKIQDAFRFYTFLIDGL